MSRKRRHHKQQPKASQPSIQGDKKHDPHCNHQNIPTSQEHKRAIIDTVVTHTSTQDKEWQNEQKGYWERQIRLSIWFNGISIVAGVIAIGALFAVFWQAKTSAISAKATVDQVVIMDATMKATERAWVTVFQGKLNTPVELGKMPIDVLELQNTGHSPAKHLSMSHDLFVWDKLPDGPISSLTLHKDEGSSLLAPSVHMGLTASGPAIITEKMLMDLVSKTKRIYSVGLITYNDILGEPHHTEFCYFVRDVRLVEFSPCSKWNDAD